MRKTIDVPFQMVNYIERLDYEQQATRLLLVDAAERGLGDSEAFKKWEQKYHESYAEFIIAKGELEKAYVMPEAGGEKVDWSLDYKSGILTIATKEGADLE